MVAAGRLVPAAVTDIITMMTTTSRHPGAASEAVRQRRPPRTQQPEREPEKEGHQGGR